MKKTTKEDGRPAFLFYPKDWISEYNMRLCSLEARGLWIEIICHMHLSPEKGKLLIGEYKNSENCGYKTDTKGNTKPDTNYDTNLAKLLGEDKEKIKRCLKELETHHIFEYDEDGAIICRRMYYENELTIKRKEAVMKRWEKNNTKNDTKNDTTLANAYANEYENEYNNENNNKEIIEALKIISKIKEYPHNPKQDAEFFLELQKEYPNINLVEEIKSWKVWIMDNPVKNYRTSIRQRFIHAEVYKNKNQEYQKIIEKSKEEDKKQKEKEKETLLRKATPPDEAVKIIKSIKEKIK